MGYVLVLIALSADQGFTRVKGAKTPVVNAQYFLLHSSCDELSSAWAGFKHVAVQPHRLAPRYVITQAKIWLRYRLGPLRHTQRPELP
jgi:hypothetical protein